MSNILKTMSNPWGDIDSANIAEATRDFRIYKKTCIRTENGFEPCVTSLMVPRGAKIHFPENKPREFLRNAEKREIRGKIRVEEAFVENSLCSPWTGFAAKFKHYFPQTAKKLDGSIIFQKQQTEKVLSGPHWSFKYKTGEMVRPTKGFDEVNMDCAGGIHGFFNEIDAEEYDL